MKPSHFRLLNYGMIVLASFIFLARLYRMDWEDFSWATNGSHYRSMLLMIVGVLLATFQLRRLGPKL
jgi:hypothetical protein